MASTKEAAPAKSKAQAVREAIETLVSQKRDVTVAAVLALVHAQGMPTVKAMDIYQSDAWKEEREKGKKTRTPASGSPKAGSTDAAAPTQGLSKSEAVKRALSTLGADAKPAAVIAHVKDKYGLEVSSQTVSNLKALLAKKGIPSGKRRGRPPKIRTEPSVAPQGASVMVSGISVEDIRAVKRLADRIGAATLCQLADVLA
jgi:hypothetical protein